MAQITADSSKALGESSSLGETDKEDMTDLAKRQQTDYTKFDKVEDVADQSPLETALSLKGEGNQKFKGADYKGAIESYSEALSTLANQDKKTKKDKAAEKDEKACRLTILSNRAVCHSNLREYKKSKADCDLILKEDGQHIKALFRRGDAYMNLSENVKAYKDLYQVVQLDPKNKSAIKKVKALRKLVHKRSIEAVHEGLAQAKRKEEEKLLKEKRRKAKEAAAAAKAKGSTTPSSSSGGSSSSARKPSSSSSSKGGKDDGDDVEIVKGESDVIRGYKKTKDGKTTSYFHRDLDDEAKKLIGDNTPKRIGVSSNDSAPRPISTQGSGSAWNSAGTWEDKDKTKWAKARLKELLLDVKIENGEASSCVVKKVEKLEGDASIISARGKVRYVYDFSFEVHFEMVFNKGSDEEKKLKSTLKYADICNDLDEGDVNTNGILKSFRKKEDTARASTAEFTETMASLRGKIRATFDVFFADFQSLA